MCQICGCSQYTKQGKEAVLKRATEIVKELGLTAQNAEDYEDTEQISRLIAPFGAVEDNVYPTAAWVGALHMSQPNRTREKHYQAHVQAFRDIFSRLPAKGEPKDIVTTYHQLEELGQELDDADLASLDPETRETVLKVNHVHDDLAVKVARLKQRYSL